MKTKLTLAAAATLAILSVLVATTPKVPPLIAEFTMEAAPSTSSPLTVTTTSAAYFVPLGYIRLTCTSPTYYALESSSAGTALTTDYLAPGPVNVNGITITRSVWINVTSDQWLALLLKGGVQGTCIVEQGSVDGVSGSFTTLAVSSTSAFTGAITNSSTYTGQGAVSAPSFDGGAFAGTTLNLSGNAVIGGAIWSVGGTAAFADAGVNSLTVNKDLRVISTLSVNTCTLGGQSPSTCTATVNASCVPVCSAQTNAADGASKCVNSGGTVTVTGPNSSTGVMSIICL